MTQAPMITWFSFSLSALDDDRILPRVPCALKLHDPLSGPATSRGLCALMRVGVYFSLRVGPHPH